MKCNMPNVYCTKNIVIMNLSNHFPPFSIWCCSILAITGIAHAGNLQPWIADLSSIQPPKEAQDNKSPWVQELWKKTAQFINASQNPSVSDDCGNAMVMLEPVWKCWPDGQAAGKKLAQILQLPEQEIGVVASWDDLMKHEEAISQAIQLRRLQKLASNYDTVAIERAINQLSERFPDTYKNGPQFLAELKALQEKFGNIDEWVKKARFADSKTLQQLVDLRRKALIEANPDSQFIKNWLTVRRYNPHGGRSNRNDDRPANWQGDTSMPHSGKTYMSEIVGFQGTGSPSPAATLRKDDRWMGHLELDFTGSKLMFTGNRFDKQDNKRPWDVYELDLKSREATSLTSHMPDDTDSYNSCYLPDGRVLFVNTSGMQGVPCVSGSDYVGNIHLLDRKDNSTRRLTFDQDNNWYPSVLADGRVMFLRWEYTESAHYFSRILMHMNPDGSDQKEYYGSNSYWPNSLFNARPLPDNPGMFVGIVSGHHGVKKLGEMVVFDVNQGRTEVEGAIQKIPGFGKKVKDVIKDQLVNDIKTPYFAEPYPLSRTSYLAVAANGHGDPVTNVVWCDIYDNIIPLTATDYFIYADPTPLKPRRKPPIIHDRVDPTKTTANVYITDVHRGRAMEGVPKGEGKTIRVFTSEYSPRNTGSHYAMGMESNWDVKVLYGTAPVNPDGSALFTVPANQPVTLQVLDGQGRALALMRSWFSAMPGETLSCIGCHETQNEAPPRGMVMASRQAPAALTPWYGPTRTFTFLNEIQPILDRNCISCHNKESHDKLSIPDFATLDPVKGAPAPGNVSYWSLHPYVRRNGPEGNYLGLKATEFFADTSELYQILKKGHHGVNLTKSDWDHLITWMDMNTPYRGDWPGKRNEQLLQRRYDLHKLYSGAVRDYVTMVDSMYKREVNPPAIVPDMPQATPAAEAAPAQAIAEPESTSINLGDSVSIKLRRIPAGSFTMGCDTETPSEKPAGPVTISKPFWMAETEITLEQYRQFDPSYENGWYDMHYKDQVRPGYNMDTNQKFPVIRVSWEKAMEFCKWLSQKTGKKVTLPTEAQWEYAARGGTQTPFYFGSKDADFSSYANLGDISLKQLAVQGVDPKPIRNPNRFWDFVPRDEKYNDGNLHLAPVASYKPNAFKLYDMIGNVAEWTRSEYRPYPWNEADGRNDTKDIHAPRAVRGGSWYERPRRATSSWRWGYPGWRPVYNVGFRIIIED